MSSEVSPSSPDVNSAESSILGVCGDVKKVRGRGLDQLIEARVLCEATTRVWVQAVLPNLY